MTSEAAPGCSQVSMGLILAKFPSAPRCPGIGGAYYAKISIYAPLYKGGGYN